MAKRDYYDILGVAKDATDDEIKKSLSEAFQEVSPGYQQRSGCRR